MIFLVLFCSIAAFLLWSYLTKLLQIYDQFKYFLSKTADDPPKYVVLSEVEPSGKAGEANRQLITIIWWMPCKKTHMCIHSDILTHTQRQKTTEIQT